VWRATAGFQGWPSARTHSNPAVVNASVDLAPQTPVAFHIESAPRIHSSRHNILPTVPAPAPTPRRPQLALFAPAQLQQWSRRSLPSILCRQTPPATPRTSHSAVRSISIVPLQSRISPELSLAATVCSPSPFTSSQWQRDSFIVPGNVTSSGPARGSRFRALIGIFANRPHPCLACVTGR